MYFQEEKERKDNVDTTNKATKKNKIDFRLQNAPRREPLAVENPPEKTKRPIKPRVTKKSVKEAANLEGSVEVIKQVFGDFFC